MDPKLQLSGAESIACPEVNAPGYPSSMSPYQRKGFYLLQPYKQPVKAAHCQCCGWNIISRDENRSSSSSSHGPRLSAKVSQPLPGLCASKNWEDKEEDTARGQESGKLTLCEAEPETSGR
ncbi:hypothetical protein PoB_005716200 [Plakobranchus ocellatus]|uniref:Uncharacterized protein n=1 Tax=Plakobranchus ocellatus TaxID=259542 RepID=A0AAV4CGC9_9GAST|nr:hypothetical protein PoB_005716200 [Plakobranchus ocellatus]